MTELQVLDGSKLKKLLQDPLAFARFVSERFKEFDKNKNGILSTEELTPVIEGVGILLGMPPRGQSPKADEMYASLLKEFEEDEHGKAVVDKARFAAVVKKVLEDVVKGLQEHPITLVTFDGAKLQYNVDHDEGMRIAVGIVFDELDVDKAGQLPGFELRTAVKQLGFSQSLPLPLEANQRLNEMAEEAIQELGADFVSELQRNDFIALVKEIIQRVAKKLHESPIMLAVSTQELSGFIIRDALEEGDELDHLISSTFKELAEVNHTQLSLSKLRAAFDKLRPDVGLPVSGVSEEVDQLIDFLFQEFDEASSDIVDSRCFSRLIRRLLLNLLMELARRPLTVQIARVVTDGNCPSPL